MWGRLRPLAVDDENCARLRETARIFLDTGCSYTATASAQILHKNTVQYRIRKAEEIMGHPVQKGHTDLEVALGALPYPGSTPLRTTRHEHTPSSGSATTAPSSTPTMRRPHRCTLHQADPSRQQA